MTSELGSKWYERKMEGEMSVRRGPQPSRARGKSSMSATLVSKTTVGRQAQRKPTGMGRPQNSWVHAQFKNIIKPNLKTSRQCLHSIYAGPYDHVIWYLWYFENSSLVNPMVGRGRFITYQILYYVFKY